MGLRLLYKLRKRWLAQPGLSFCCWQLESARLALGPTTSPTGNFYMLLMIASRVIGSSQHMQHNRQDWFHIGKSVMWAV